MWDSYHARAVPVEKDRCNDYTLLYVKPKKKNYSAHDHHLTSLTRLPRFAASTPDYILMHGPKASIHPLDDCCKGHDKLLKGSISLKQAFSLLIKKCYIIT